MKLQSGSTPIITSILDSDLYKFTMQFFVIQHYSEIDVEYTFNNRSKTMVFNDESVNLIKENVQHMSTLKLKDYEYDWMKINLPFLPISYRQYLAAYKFNPNQVNIKLQENGELDIKIKGKWRDTILWEVPLMSIISEVYFKVIDIDWNMDGQLELARLKASELDSNGCLFADFGSRRRRNYNTQDIVIKNMMKFDGFVGTSNPHFALKYNIKSLGTCAHEAIGAVSVLESANHPNKYFMEKWSNTYKGRLGTMLPDTYGTDSFLKDFTMDKAKLWDGVRHDSGDPYEFTDKIVNHYKNIGIDPTTKTIIFSDGLNNNTAIKLKNYCDGKIRCSFGIGTFFTSDFKKISNKTKSEPMNIVIKLTKVDGVPVVKLSDSPGKSIGDPKMLEIMKYLHFS